MPKGSNGEHLRRWRLITLALMFFAYASMMACKVAFTALSPAMKRDPLLGMTTAKYGRIVSWNSQGAIFGKAVTGATADKIGGKAMLLVAMLMLAATTAAFCGVSHLFMFAVLNFSMMFFKAGGWPAMAKIIGAWYPLAKHGRAWSIIAMSSRVGTVVGGLLISWLLLMVPWRVIFLCVAAPALIVAVVVWTVLKDRPEDIPPSHSAQSEKPTPSTNAQPEAKPPHPLDGTTLRHACIVFLRSPRVILISLSMLLLNILMDFINFLPLYLSETLSFSDSKAALVGSTIFPAGMFAALIACGLGYDRISKKQLERVLGGLLATACLCVAILWKLPSYNLSGGEHLAVSMSAIFVLGFAVSPAYYLPMSVFSVKFGGEHSGFLISSLDIFGYFGSFVFAYFGGSIAEEHGWSAFLFILLIVAAISCLAMTAFLRLDDAAETS